MSKSIILANIGNRNIKYLNQGYPNDLIPKKVFYEKTKFIWENQGELQNIRSQILPAIIKKFPESKLILFTSHQSPPFQYQDTYFEGLILKKLLEQDWPKIEIEAQEMKGINPTQEDDLVKWFRNKINYYKNIYKDNQFVVYNTGGTPQQKNALKAVVEFYFDGAMREHQGIKTTYKLFQGLEMKDDETKIEEIKKTAIEELNQLTNVKLLIQHNNYGGALQIENNLLNKNAKKILQYIDLLWNGMWSEIDLHFPVDGGFCSKLKMNEGFEVIRNFDKSNFDKPKTMHLFPRFYRIVQINISKAYNQQKEGNYSGSILSLHHFLENFISSFIESNSEFKIYTKRRKVETKVINYLLSNYEVEINRLFGFIPSHLSLPLLLFLASKLSGEKETKEISSIIETFMNTQSTFKSEDFPPDKKLDTLRNGIAHEGKGISKEIFRIYQPLIETHYQLFCSQDPFLELNHFISGLI